MGNIAEHDESFIESETGEEAFLVDYVVQAEDTESLVKEVLNLRVKSGQSFASAQYLSPKLAIVQIQENRIVNYVTRELV